MSRGEGRAVLWAYGEVVGCVGADPVGADSEGIKKNNIIHADAEATKKNK